MSSKAPYYMRNVADFWTDEDVAWLSQQDGVAHLIYSALLDHMWNNGGSIRDDDRVIADMLRVDLGTWLRVRPFVEQLLISFPDENGLARLTQKRLARDFAAVMKKIEERNQNFSKGREKANAPKQAKPRKTQAKSAARQDPETGASDKAQPQAPAAAPSPYNRIEQNITEVDTDVSTTTPSSERVVAVERGSGGEKNATDKKVTGDQTLKPKSLSEIANMIRGGG